MPLLPLRRRRPGAGNRRPVAVGALAGLALSVVVLGWALRGLDGQWSRAATGPLTALPAQAALPPAGDSSPAGGPLESWAAPPLRVRWLYYVPRASWDSFGAHAGQIDVLSPHWFTFRGDGSLKGDDDARVVRTVRAGKGRLVPMVSNDGDGELLHNVLASPPARLHAIQATVSLVLQNRYDGVHLDLEGLPSSDREAVVTFVRAIAEPLRAQGKLVTMALPAKTHETTTGWAGPYDYRALGEVCDLVTVMAYDYRVPASDPGPVAPLRWVEAVARYTVTQIPPRKVLLGVPFYGYDWNRQTGAPGRTLSYERALAIAAQPGASLAFDPEAQTFTLRYQDGNGHPHEAWFEDGNSLAAKLALARRYGLAGFAAWRLGLEDPGVWSAIAAASAAPAN